MKFDNLQEKRPTALADWKKDDKEETFAIFRDLINSITISHYCQLAFPDTLLSDVRFSVKNHNQTDVIVTTTNDNFFGSVTLGFCSNHADAEVEVKMMASYTKQIT